MSRLGQRTRRQADESAPKAALSSVEIRAADYLSPAALTFTDWDDWSDTDTKLARLVTEEPNAILRPEAARARAENRARNGGRCAYTDDLGSIVTHDPRSINDT